jgi:hypothetical protein
MGNKHYEGFSNAKAITIIVGIIMVFPLLRQNTSINLKTGILKCVE